MASSINRIIGSLYEKGKNKTKSGEVESVEQKPLVKSETLSMLKSGDNFFKKTYTRIKEFTKNHSVDFKYLLYAIPIIAIFLIARAVQNHQSLSPKAAIHTASASFQVSQWSLPPTSTFGVWLNTDSPAAFANIKIAFDPKLVKLTSEINVTGPLTRIVKVSTMAEANSSGNISIVLGLDPTKISTPPSGAFQIANLTFDINTTNQNVSMAITFDASQTQLVAIDQSVFAFTATNLNLVLNPTATPSPVITPTTAPTVAPSQTPTSTCSKCFKKQCDGICEKGDSKTLCPDCL
jgi:hypothetical protein